MLPRYGTEQECKISVNIAELEQNYGRIMKRERKKNMRDDFMFVQREADDFLPLNNYLIKSEPSLAKELLVTNPQDARQ